MRGVTWAVVYLSVFPTAYFLSATFTEGLFLALAIASVYYARTGKWPFAGVLSLFAALTRITGVLLSFFFKLTIFFVYFLFARKFSF